MPTTECQYYLSTCLLCGSGSCSARLKPFSAGERVLAIDGGGTHGVIPLEIMATIQETMGSCLQLQDLFDIAFGTSVGKFRAAEPSPRLISVPGGLLVCILFLRNMPVMECTQVFDNLARKLFGRPQGPTNFVKRARLLLRGWYKDGHYDANALEELLKQYLGHSDRMFGFQPGVLRTKVGVVAATIGNASPVIFTNYNGLGARKDVCGV